MKYFDCTRSGPRSAFDSNVVYQFEIMEYVSFLFLRYSILLEGYSVGPHLAGCIICLAVLSTIVVLSFIFVVCLRGCFPNYEGIDLFLCLLCYSHFNFLLQS